MMFVDQVALGVEHDCATVRLDVLEDEVGEQR